MSQASENEKLKLTAAWLNGVSLAIIAAGVVLPFFNHILKGDELEGVTMVVLFVSCFAVAIALHLIGLAIAGGIE